ncbi:hypothetical protein [Sphingomonas sp.]|jgi:hypothetical protein|uniref:hypothetical protein n=1 Tax=Sphingomonas sp. TaxID=28214 RepID=UPI002D7F634C|nr:hypothetical protein [Sphingomonas sp.]HEU0045672.1 hypothetical protein [Sphingomonas sp.]
MIRFFLFAPIALAAAAPALAADQVALQSNVRVERTEMVDGRQQVVLKAPGTVVPGDKLLFQTSYKNAAATPATRFVVTNPVPAAVAWTGEGTAGVEASVDGGRSFAPLPALKVKDSDGTPRAAGPADATHLRWTLASIAAGAGGQLSYRGVVR